MSDQPPSSPSGTDAEPTEQPKSSLSLLLGALTSGMLAWISLRLSGGLVHYFALHGGYQGSAIGESIASGLRTLLVGMAFLATFSFAFIGLGLLLVLGRRLITGSSGEAA
ncbi:DUF3082 domain-containing protein [Synechococcus sp. RSCCF101]|uniref:DUF3082 domain-containing protein n=1 Tax=Synechococcus sp. RSCCF101 TaxID=2511069 RepID=UPI001245FAD0|nr:DUF3082 domain-containing protein [Synechococcus sp. RSCCF101]QEY31582.1 DUF3082 domain-containing protein [Synechococcus sp. RSCCF101]